MGVEVDRVGVGPSSLDRSVRKTP